jgi:hypothetical protein
LRLWENEFFNRGIGDVITLGTPLAGSLPETIADVDVNGLVIDRSGQKVRSEFALADGFNLVLGEEVAVDREHRMSLVRVAQPMRIPQTLTGVFGDGWSGNTLSYTRYACTGGDVALRVASDVKLRVGPVDVVPRIGDTVLPPTSVPPDGAVVPVIVKLVPKDGMCQVQFDIAATVVPQEVSGVPDTRALGVLVSGVTYTP